MIVKMVAIPFIATFTLSLLFFTYVARLFSLASALTAYLLSYFIGFFESPTIYKIVSSVLSFGELSCIINKQNQGELNEKKIRSK